MHEPPPILFTLVWSTCLIGLFLIARGELTFGGGVAIVLLSGMGWLAFLWDRERHLKDRPWRNG